MRPRRWVLGLAVGAVTMGGGAACSGGTTPLPTIERVVIPAGASFAAITDTLVAHGVVTHPTWFKLLGRMRGLDRSVQAGVYEFPKPSSSANLSNVPACPTFRIPSFFLTAVRVSNEVISAGLARRISPSRSCIRSY